MTEPVRLDDFEELARARLEPGAYDYYAGGAWDEVTLRDNVDAFGRYRLRPRVLRDVSAIDLRSEMLGTAVGMPVGLAPTALQTLAHPEGEVATARAAAAAEAMMCLSTIAGRSLEDVATAGGPRWMQLYVFTDRDLSAQLVKRAEIAGYEAIVLTADLPVAGYRERDLRNHFVIPSSHGLGNFTGIDTSGQELLPFISSLNDASLTWDDVDWVRSLTSLPVLVKGILTAEDALLAVERGAAGIFVSNHGGRQLDRAPATIDVLEEVVDAVADRAEVYLDGGVRRGTDVLVALALGATGVFSGRPYLWALAAGGQAGVASALGLLRAEIVTAMALLGAPNVAAIERSHVARY